MAKVDGAFVLFAVDEIIQMRPEMSRFNATCSKSAEADRDPDYKPSIVKKEEKPSMRQLQVRSALLQCQASCVASNHQSLVAILLQCQASCAPQGCKQLSITRRNQSTGVAWDCSQSLQPKCCCLQTNTAVGLGRLRSQS